MAGSKSLGVLTLDLVAKIGGYEQGLDKAEREAKKRAAAIEKAFDQAATGIGVAMGAALAGITAAFAGFQSAIQAVGDFQDLAEKTGASAEGLASFALAAGVAGNSMDEVAAASIKLTKNLTGVDDDSKAAGAAIKALGLNLQDFKKLAPEDQMDEVAKALGRFEDGAGKTAVALDLFGKSGADLLPFFKELNESGGRTVILTQEMIEQADAYADAQSRMTAELKIYAQYIAAQALPYVTAFTGALVDTIKEVLGLDKGVSDLRGNTGVTDFAETAVRALAFVVDSVDGVVRAFQIVGKTIGAAAAQAAAVANGEFKQVLKIGQEWQKDVGAILEKPLFSSKLDARLAALRKGATPSGSNPQKPRLSYAGANTKAGGGSSDDPTKKLLDNQLKELERYISAEKDLMSERNKFLDLFNSQGLISIKDYYQAQGDIRDEATKNQIKAYDQEIEALRKYQASTAKKTDKAEAQGKINELLEKQAKLQKDAGLSALESGLKQTQAMKEYANTIAETNARLLELQGEVGKAAAIRFDLQNEGLSKLFSAQGNTEMGEKLKRIRELTIAQADLNKLSGDYSLIQGQLQIAEDRIALAQKIGTQGELDGLVKLGEARKASYDQLKNIAEQYEKIAKASGDPQMLLKADQLKLALEQLSAELDPLANKFNTMFSDAASSAFGDFISGTKSAKDAFRGFIDDVFSQITKMVSQNLFQKLFGGMLGGDSGGGFNFGSLLSGLFGGGRASGGPVAPNTMYRVNEQGPELFKAANGEQFLMTGTQGGSVIPNGDLRGRGGQVVNVQIKGYVKPETPNQIAREVRRQSNIAASRFGG